ncbi:Polypeptide N-acetylgalactosaminyltransferase [Fasciola gigantica]|uniref:Polypeptide N-acetylgalactosaminyltransferase n=1 Tax=Fasciola gigantica TaxID=46835 RepID=A0A504YAY9_FASGI|nr:Polypeptide N-acetylgalactosaminyltransferase [Fasciola gigantica]
MRIRPTRIIRLIAYVATFFFSSSIIFYALTPSKHQSSNQEAVLASFLLQPRASLPFLSGVSNNELVSWEDENLKETEAKREGPGEQGHPVRLVGPEKKISEKFFNQNGFNIYISDKIAVDRAVGDIRHPRCKSMSYLRKLPTASIIVPFFEEHWSTLLRTFVGVLKRTPNELIKEVILVDDGSTLRPELKDKLDNYLKTNYPNGLVRVIHSPSREGLIRARITGAKAATGDVLVFLDSHCEPSHNWLPPLLDPIARDYRTVVCPFIDVIDADTFEYRAQDEGARGAFDWELYYKRLPKLPKDEPSPELPFESPVMAGGLFAISSKWFWELGGYDPGLEIWGGEQYELSFKLWMCGGRMIDVPCSRVGHIYRKHPTNFPSARGKGDFVGRNYNDKIAVDRAVGDIRHPRCKSMSYLRKLPTASIIVPFFEEHWSTLLRTFVGVLKRTPNELIKEVILVDDGSTLRPELKDKLDNYLKTNYPNGLVVSSIHLLARVSFEPYYRAKAATGDVLVFLDSHCEPSHNWLPPLLDPIARDYRTVVCPFIDVIDADTFEYRAQDEGARGAFDWELYYKRLPKLPKDEPSPELPFESPVMAGGLFAISSKWFSELGGYDPGLEIWGGEQYELSFKLWMCGGRMIDVPCSRVGHIYRKHPTNFPSARGKGDFVGRNYKRVAEVWMDEYKEYIYNRRPHYRALDTGDLSEQHAVRERLKCKSFKWFMTEVAFDLTKKYPLIDPIPAATGDIRSAVDPSLCIEALEASEVKPIRLSKCVRDGAGLNGMQKFELSYHDDIRPVKLTNCFDLPHASPRASITLYPCHGGHGNQYWQALPVRGNDTSALHIRHVPSDFCLESDVETQSVIANPCRLESRPQQWIWEKLQFKEAVESRKLAGV